MKQRWAVLAGFCMSGIGFLFMAAIALFPPFNDGSRQLQPELSAQYGTLVGGVVGPLFSLAAFLLIYQTIRDQRHTSRLEQFERRLFQLLDFFNSTVQSLSASRPSSRPKAVDEGRDIFIHLKSQGVDLYKKLEVLFPELPAETKLNVDFLVLYYGVSKATIETTKAMLSSSLSPAQTDRLLAELTKKKTVYNSRIVFYGGHQSALGNYYRQLFHIVRYIDEAEYLQASQKRGYVKFLRTLLSNYEQAMLFFDSMSALGAEWRNKGWIERYGLIKNMPLHFLEPIDPKAFYPKLLFEYEQRAEQTT